MNGHCIRWYDHPYHDPHLASEMGTGKQSRFGVRRTRPDLASEMGTEMGTVKQALFCVRRTRPDLASEMGTCLASEIGAATCLLRRMAQLSHAVYVPGRCQWETHTHTTRVHEYLHLIVNKTSCCSDQCVLNTKPRRTARHNGSAKAYTACPWPHVLFDVSSFKFFVF